MNRYVASAIIIASIMMNGVVTTLTVNAMGVQQSIMMSVQTLRRETAQDSLSLSNNALLLKVRDV